MVYKRIVVVMVAVLCGRFASVGDAFTTAHTQNSLVETEVALTPPTEAIRTQLVAARAKRDAHEGHGHDAHGEHQQSRTGKEAHQDGKHNEHDTDKDHGEHTDHREHREHSDHDDHGETPVITLSDAEQREFGIEVGTAAAGELRKHVTLPGEVALNADRLSHVVPRVSGVAQAVYKTLGDQVHVGDVLAVLDSRELADVKSVYLTAAEEVALAEATYRREGDLRQEKITSQHEYLQAKQGLAAARIARRAAAQKLRALGFSAREITALPKEPSDAFTRYAITAPFDGTIIEKHIALGEVLRDDTTAFVVADLSSVWVDLRVYPNDLPLVRPGQAVVITAGRGLLRARGTIAYVGPVIGEKTRTALARVVLPNPKGRWRPGLFVTATVDIDSHDVTLLIPETALQTVEGRPAVFIETATGFTPQTVTLGRRNDAYIEVTSGLKPGQRYVTRGAFTLKAQLAKGSFGDGHAH